jgi:hypothetical protein
VDKFIVHELHETNQKEEKLGTFKSAEESIEEFTF